MSQRKAAEKTRQQFGLATFSHTTIGRAMKRLEKLIKRYETVEKDSSAGNMAKTEDDGAGNVAKTESGGEFPSVESTKSRRLTILRYIKTALSWKTQGVYETLQQCSVHVYRRLPYTGTFIDACHNIVRQEFIKHQCLLL